MRKEHEQHQQPELPTPLEVNFETIPRLLKEIPQWVAWRYRVIDGEIKKPPYDPKTGRLASVANPDTWGSFADAKRAYERGAGDGIGLILSRATGIVGIDLDHCIQNGTIMSDAQAIMTALPPTYTERSPSGEGLRLFLKGSLPGPYRRKGHIELYDNLRFLTVTGHHLPHTPTEVSSDQSRLEAVYSRIFAQMPSPSLPSENTGGGEKQRRTVSDEVVLAKAYAAKNGQVFARYYEGDNSLWEGTGKSQSEADFTLCLYLLYWTNGDSAQVDRLFRKSGLMRSKWDRPMRGKLTYGQYTLTNAQHRRRR